MRQAALDSADVLFMAAFSIDLVSYPRLHFNSRIGADVPKLLSKASSSLVLTLSLMQVSHVTHLGKQIA